MIIPRGTQKEVIELPVRGHNVVLGVAGSGKSVCALQRAKFIRDMNINAQISDLSKVNDCINDILILSYNRTLATYLGEMAKEQDSFANIEVKTYHSFATDQMRRGNILDDNDIIKPSLTQKQIKWREKNGINCDTKETLIKEAIEFIKKEEHSKGNEISTLSRTDFIIDEITWFQRIGALSFEEYHTIERTGRGRGGLTRNHREYIFRVYMKYMELREESGYRYDWDDISYYYYQDLIKHPPTKQQYRHILIDEGQDFSSTMIRSLVSYLGDNGSIMFFSDSAQQIYGSSRTPWRNVGLRINKTYTLNENFRNTKQIENLAKAVKEKIGLEIEEKTDSIYNSNEGQLPSIVRFNLEEEELDFIRMKAEEFSKVGTVAVIFRTNENVETFFGSLHSLQNVEKTHVNRDSEYIRNKKGILVGTYQALKGMEFDSVIIPFCTDRHLILEKRTAALGNTEEVDSEVARLLYVAMTRAKKNLLITYTDSPTRVFPENLNLYNSLMQFGPFDKKNILLKVTSFSGMLTDANGLKYKSDGNGGYVVELPSGNTYSRGALKGSIISADGSVYFTNYSDGKDHFNVLGTNGDITRIDSFPTDVISIDGSTYYYNDRRGYDIVKSNGESYSIDPLFSGFLTADDGSKYYPDSNGGFTIVHKS